MRFRNLKIWALCGFALAAAGCTTEQLTAFSCTFDNDPYAPRSAECLALDRQQDQNARIARLDREIAKNRSQAARALQAEADARFAAFKERVAAMPAGGPLYEAGDLKGAIEATSAKYREFFYEKDWYTSRNISPPREFALLCAEALAPRTWYLLFEEDFATVVRDARMLGTERNGAYCDDPSLLAVKTNLAHAFMFQGELDLADTVYQDYRGVYLFEGPEGLWENVIAADFEFLRANGLSHPHMDVVLRRFESGAIDAFRDSLLDR